MIFETRSVLVKCDRGIADELVVDDRRVLMVGMEARLSAKDARRGEGDGEVEALRYEMRTEGLKSQT